MNTDLEYFFKTLSPYTFPEVNQFCTVTGNLITEFGEPTKSLIVRLRLNCRTSFSSLRFSSCFKAVSQPLNVWA